MNWSVFHCTSKLILSNQLLIRLGRVIFLLKITESGRVGIQRRSDRPSRTSIVCAKAAVCVRTCHTVSSKTIEQQPRVPGFLSISPTPFSFLPLSKILFQNRELRAKFSTWSRNFLEDHTFRCNLKMLHNLSFLQPFLGQIKL